jgi:adenosylcobyric acid synthase
VLGVIPYYKDIHIEEEDSLELVQKQRAAVQGKVNIAVVLLRHLSNFTDFNMLERDERVSSATSTFPSTTKSCRWVTNSM